MDSNGRPLFGVGPPGGERKPRHSTVLSGCQDCRRIELSVTMKPILSLERATQLAVFLSNRPGALVRVCDALADADINIHALSTSDTVDHSVVRMVVSDPTKALMLLGEAGVLALENEVLIIELDNEPGSLAAVAAALSKADVNIEYAYLAATGNPTGGYGPSTQQCGQGGAIADRAAAVIL